MNKIKILLSLSIFFFLGTTLLFADVAPESKEKESTELQRKIYGFYDVQRNRVSNIEFAITNTGKLFYDDSKPSGSQGTGIWPRGSVNYYVFGGGVWVGSQKKKLALDANGNPLDSIYTQEIKRYDREHPIIQNGDTVGFPVVTESVQKKTYKIEAMQTIMALTYNPYNGQSMMVPGRIEDGVNTVATDPARYRVFFSEDYNGGDGSPLVEDSAPIWPIWDDVKDDSVKYNRYFGHYIRDENLRNLTQYPKGPAFISGEDMFCTYKDSDLSKYNFFGGASTLAAKGYPLKIQYEQMVYSWGFGDYKDFVFIKYEQQNTSPDTLWNMWLAPVFDVDIAFATNPAQGANNDRCSFYGMEGKSMGEKPDPEKSKKNFAYQWSDGDMGEAGRGFGYVGFVFLESPAVIPVELDIDKYSKDTLRILHDSVGFVRKDKRVYETSEQLGLVTYRNWSRGDDKRIDTEMYAYISSDNERDGDTGPGDKRYMMATGPFNLRPGDTSRTVVGLVLAGTGKGGDADGTDEDLTELVRKVDFAQSVYDNNFRAPQPPLRAKITEWTPLNHGMIIKWDETSEMSEDKYEAGLDFMGYRIYRARRSNLDTFSVNNISPNTQYSAGTGPLGWKMVREYSLPTPFVKSQIPEYGRHAVTDPSRPRATEHFSGIDSIMVIGPVWVNNDSIDITAIRVMRIPRGVNMYPPTFVLSGQNNPAFPRLNNSGIYTDAVYGTRIIPVINSIDTVGSEPWGQFLTKIVKADGLDFNNSALYYKGQHNYLFDSIMVGTIHFNQSLAKFNPLFYSNKKITITEKRFEELVAMPIDKGEIWRTVDEKVWNPVDEKWENVKKKIELDTLYKLETYAKTTGPSGQDMYTIDIVVLERDKDYKKDLTKMLRSWEHFVMVRDSVYSYLSKGWAKKLDFYDISSSDRIKEEVIKPYMKKITNNRTFVDIGDDDRDAFITTNSDIGKTEKMFNNVPYYYKIVSFDEGDYLQPTPMKSNEGLPGLPNFAETYPSAERVGKKLDFTVLSLDTNKIGGLYDFNLFAIDPQRASQVFAGDTLELEFTTLPYLSSFILNSKTTAGKDTTSTITAGIYYVEGKIRNISQGGKEVFNTNFALEPQNCIYNYTDFYTEYAATRAGSAECVEDPIKNTKNCFGVLTNDSVATINSFVTTGDFKTKGYCFSYSFAPEAYGTLGLDFRTSLQQYGGVYRQHSAEKINTNATTMINPVKITSLTDSTSTNMLFTTRRVANEMYSKGLTDGEAIDFSFPGKQGVVDASGYGPVFGRFNNGPGVYEVEFLPGGEENLTLVWDGGNSQKTYKVKYLVPKITNVLSYKRPAPELSGVDSVDVKYDTNIEPIILPIQPSATPVLQNGFSYRFMPVPFALNLPLEGRKAEELIGKFNLYAECYINCRNKKLAIDIRKRIAQDKDLLNQYNLVPGEGVKYVGKQNRYYVSMISEDGDTLDFVHSFNISGSQFVADYFGRGMRYVSNTYESYMDGVPAPAYGEDFKAGDKLRFTSRGGALGFPVSGAKVRFAVSETQPVSYTDDMLEDIKVVPNPYVVSHQAQSSPYGAKLFFTKLPVKCTIKIYTVSGDLVDTIEHDETLTSSDGKYGVDIWNLLTKNGQRVQSQTLVALIETPDGATTTKQFSVVVGGFRVVE